MRIIPFIGWLMVLAGSFLPLMRVPVLGNFNYLQIDQRLATICWVLAFFALIFFLLKKQRGFKIIAALLLLLFIFTILAIKYQTNQFFSFLHFRSVIDFASKIVHLGWGWFIEFAGALLMFFNIYNQTNYSTK